MTFTQQLASRPNVPVIEQSTFLMLCGRGGARRTVDYDGGIHYMVDVYHGTNWKGEPFWYPEEHLVRPTRRT